MPKLISTAVFFLFFFSIKLLAQQNYLISINLNKVQNPEKLEALKIPVYHIFEHDLITNLSPESLAELSGNRIEYSILDKNSDHNRYYILSKRNKNNPTEYVGEVLYRSNSSVLIKAEYADESLYNDFIPIEIKKRPLHFMNEKVIPLVKTSSSIDSTIQNVIANINVDSVKNFITGLQDFKTRYLFASNRDSVANWIKGQFMRMGFTDVVLDSFFYRDTWQKNVIATLEGSSLPEYVFIAGGHYDSYSTDTDPLLTAPGADDNASGTAAVLELARVIKKSGYIPESTIKFIAFAAEESGLHGSFDYADKAYLAKMKIKLMINHDMISYTSKPLNESHVSIHPYTGSEYFGESAKLNTGIYTNIKPFVGSENFEYCDSYPFWINDFPALFFFEYNFSPYYHTSEDIAANYNMEYCTEVIKTSCATLINALEIPLKVENLKIIDAGDSESLIISWIHKNEPDFAGYRIYLGTESSVYFKTYETTASSIKLTDLQEGINYHIGVAVIDQDGNESPIIEKSGIPFKHPLPPTNLNDNPKLHGIEITWQKNLENDLLGYNIYRSGDINSSFIKLNNSIISDTFYVDASVSDGTFYNYKTKAVDSLNNESLMSNSIKSRSVSLNQGILIVDETADGNGSISKPDDIAVDSFYNNILSEFKFSSYDLIKEAEIKLADIGAFSTVIWYGDDFFDQSIPFSKIEEIKKYLNYGGNFIYSGFRPSRAFAGVSSTINNIDTTFLENDFIRSCLKISASKAKFGTRFIGAKAVKTGYIDLHVDTTKTLSSANYHLSNIETIIPADGAKVIFSYDSRFDSSTPQGSIINTPVGIEYIEEDYKAVVLSFPLYYIKEDDAKEFISSVLTKFNEVTGVQSVKKEEIPNQFTLNQNYPNPFNPFTVIGYQLSVISKVNLKIYDMLGREVATLVNREQSAGYYKVEFSAGSIGVGSKLSSGIYTYVIRISPLMGHSQDILISKKMVLLK